MTAINSLVLNKLTFIVGNQKNAGKTTFLNFLLKKIRQETRIAYTSIGVDGEMNDSINRNLKPQIFCYPGDTVITAESCLKTTSCQYEIEAVFPIKTILGRILAIRILREGYLELIGPENNQQLSQILTYLNEEKGIKTIFIDGAINRFTQIASFKAAQFIYVMMIDQANLNQTLEQVLRIDFLSNLKDLEDLPPAQNNSYSIEGALTRSRAALIPDQVKTIIVDNQSSIFLSLPEIKRLTQKYDLYLKQRSDLLFFVFNLRDVSEKLIRQRLKDKINSQFIFNPYQVRMSG